MNKSQDNFYRLACISLVGLIILGFLWEMFLAPYKPGGSIFVLKIIPLFFPLSGIFKKNIYTMQWASMFILFYFIEGVVRAMGDINAASRMLAMMEIFLSVVFFGSTVLFVRPFKKLAKAAKKQAT